MNTILDEESTSAASVIVLLCGCGGVTVSLAKVGFKVECVDYEMPRRELQGGAIKVCIADLEHALEFL